MRLARGFSFLLLWTIQAAAWGCQSSGTADSGDTVPETDADSDADADSDTDADADADADTDTDTDSETDTFPCPSEMVLIPVDTDLGVDEEFCVDRWEASRDDATEVSMGSDTSVARSRSGVIPWYETQMSSSVLEEFQAACEAVGKRLCDGSSP